MRRSAIFVLCALIAVGVYVNLRSIQAFPNWSATDEAIIHDYVDSWQRTGSIEASLVPYPAPTITGSLYIYAAALWKNLFPNDPFALRNFSALGGFALIAVVFGVAYQLKDRLTGLIAAALLATNLLWTAVAHVGRQEIWLAVVVWAAIGLSLAAQRRKSIALALLAGIVVALSTEVHPLGAAACLALGIWWIRETRKHNAHRLLLAFISGGLLGTACYLWAHVLPDPAYFAQALYGELISYGAEGWTPLAAMLERHLNYLLSNPLELGLLTICSIFALRQRHTGGLGIFLAAVLLLYALTVADANLYYPIIWITGMVILSALALRRLAPTRRAPLALAFFAAFIVNTGLIERHIGAHWNARAL
ncbi:MAG: glycosyltransferase family 39 protein, partial [Chloroflexota bacterium]